MKKKMIIILGVVGILLIGIGVFANSIIKDKEETNKVMNSIITDYDSFENSVLDFNEKRDTIYKTIFVDSYYDTIKTNYNTWNNSMKEYENTVDKVISFSTNLKKNCNGMYYSKSEVNEKCNSFNSLYEEVNNSFVTDVKSYNKLITSYNEYLEEDGVSDTKLLLYTSTKKYVDINKDKNFEGKD